MYYQLYHSSYYIIPNLIYTYILTYRCPRGIILFAGNGSDFSPRKVKISFTITTEDRATGRQGDSPNGRISRAWKRKIALKYILERIPNKPVDTFISASWIKNYPAFFFSNLLLSIICLNINSNVHFFNFEEDVSNLRQQAKITFLRLLLVNYT